MNQAVSQLFFSAIELAPAERRRHLAEAPVPESVRALAARLVAAHENAGDFLESTVQAGFELLSSRVGQHLGAYRLTELLAEGGMGEVYRASYADASQRPVVVKLPKKTLVRAREREVLFEREGQLLNMLRHPNIVALYHRGTTAQEATYLVMEYVAGANLMAYAKSRNLTLAQKLQLFRSLCQPISFCHGRGVIHCDLKPENILVDETGTVKLIDFGVAHRLDEALEVERHPYTLPYASPEQVKGGELSAATDIHALGVLLYQLLVEELPFKGQCQMSRRAALLKGQPTLAARQLNSLPAPLARLIRRCVAVDPSARFANVPALLNELALVEHQLQASARAATAPRLARTSLARHSKPSRRTSRPVRARQLYSPPQRAGDSAVAPPRA